MSSNGAQLSFEAAERILNCIVLYRLGTCSCKLEEGALRVDANISVSRAGEPLGTRTEVKNLNSMRAISRAIDFEIRRQIAVIEAGGVVTNETRMFNSDRQATVVMRDKEVHQDYRFMPEPNLPSIRVSTQVLDDFRKAQPILPKQEREDLMRTYALQLEMVLPLVTDPALCALFVQIMSLKADRDAATCQQLITNELETLLKARKQKLGETLLTTTAIGEVVDLLHVQEISWATALDILTMCSQGHHLTPAQMVVEFDWKQIHGEEEVRKWCEAAIAEMPKRARSYSKNGKRYAFDMLMRYVADRTQKRVEASAAKDMFNKLLRPPTVGQDVAEPEDGDAK